jgi:hypothetical protein
MGAFARTAVAGAAFVALFAVESVGVSASARADANVHFRPVVANGPGPVTVRDLPAPRANSHTQRPLHAFLRMGTGVTRGGGVPVTTVGDSATAATATEQVVSGFTGVTLAQQVSALGNDQAVTPPDTQIAAGPNSLLEMVNSNGSVWTKSGALVKIFDLNSFFPVPAGYTFSDPRVLYDAISGRWFASGVAFVTPSFGSVLVFAVSDTNDPTGTWHVYSADNSSNVTHDQPKIGVSTDKVALSFNDFLNAAVFQGASTWVFGKAAMLAGASSIPGQAVGPDSRRVSIVPAIELTSTSTEFMAYNNSDCGYSGCNAGYPSIGIVALTGDPSIGTLAWSESDPAIAGTSQPPAADQPGLPGSIQTNDDRFLTAVWQSDTLWVDGNDACTPPGDSAVRPCPRLIQVSTAGSTVNQNFDLGSAGNDLYYPAVHVDSATDMYVVYNISSTSQDVGVRLTGQPAGSAPQFVVPAQTIEAGQGLYTCANRWGDYSGSALDPTNPSSVWLAAEYAGASSTNCNWATFISQVTFAVPTTADFSLSASPASQSVVAGNSTSYTVTVRPTGGFNAAVTLSVGGLPSGANGTFNPNNQAMTSSTLSVTTTTGTAPGSYPLTITGTSGTLTHTTSATLTVTAPPPPADFSLGSSPASQSVVAGNSTSYSVTITPTGGFNAAVTLSVSGLPSGANGTFNPNNQVMTSSTLSVTTSTGTAPGSYPLTITGTSGTLTHTTSVTLTVTAPPPPADFSLSASPSSRSVGHHGGSVTYIVTITPSNGFTGMVALSLSGLPSRASGSFSPNPATTSSTLTVTTSNRTTVRSYTLTITGVSGSLTHTTTVTLVVT